MIMTQPMGLQLVPHWQQTDQKSWLHKGEMFKTPQKDESLTICCVAYSAGVIKQVTK